MAAASVTESQITTNTRLQTRNPLPLDRASRCSLILHPRTLTAPGEPFHVLFQAVTSPPSTGRGTADIFTKFGEAETLLLRCSYTPSAKISPAQANACSHVELRKMVARNLNIQLQKFTFTGKAQLTATQTAVIKNLIIQ